MSRKAKIETGQEDVEKMAEGPLLLRPRPMKCDEDPDMFIRGFKRLSKANVWGENKQLAILPALVGEAHEWLAQELEEDSSLTTVELMCTKIVNRLIPAEKRRAYLHEFYEVKMTEDDEPRDIASKLRTLIAAAMPDLSQEAKEQMVSEQLPRVVPPKWRLRVLDSEATTAEALVRRIERIKTTEQLKSSLGHDDGPVGRPVRLVKCFVCCKVGHKAAQCPSKSQCDSRKQSGAGRPEIVCFQCGGKGHMKYQCPSPNGKPSRETRSGHMGNPGPSSGEILSRDNRASQVRRVDAAEKSAPTEICAVIKLNGKNVEAVVDTGSSCSILSAEVASELQLPVDASDEQSYIAANSTVVSSLGSAKVNMMIGDETVEHVFTISDDITDSVILGMDVLHAMKAVVDCASGSLQIGLKQVPVTVDPTRYVSRRVRVKVRLINVLAGRRDEHDVVTDESAGLSGSRVRKVEVDGKKPILPDVSHVEEPYRQEVEHILQQHQAVFAQTEDEVGNYRGPHKLTIDTEGATPVKQKAYRTPMHLKVELRNQLENLEKKGLIEPSKSPWASPSVGILDISWSLGGP